MKEFESNFHALLKKEKLFDFSQFLRPDFFDEIPLYSRYNDVSFLNNLKQSEKDSTLLSFMLSYIDSIANYIDSHDEIVAYLIGVTLLPPEDAFPIVPMLFICTTDRIGYVRERVNLSHRLGRFSKSIRDMINRVKSTKFEVLEDRETIPDMVRVFIGHRKPTSTKMLTIHQLLATSN